MNERHRRLSIAARDTRLPPRTRLYLGGAGLSYLASASFTIFLGCRPEHYYPGVRVRGEPAPFEVPWVTLTIVCAIMLAEAFAVTVMLDPSREGPLWRRTGFGVLAFAVWAVPSTMFGTLHMPDYMEWHAVWVWLLLTALVVTTAASLVATLVRRVRRG